MHNLNKQIYISILVAISVLVYVLYFTFVMSGMDSAVFLDYIKPVTTVISIDSLLVLIFVKWLWKWNKLYPWLVPFPDLNGTWEGFLKSNWTCPNTGKKVDEIPIILTINQTFINISCTMRTGEMCSESFSSGFIINTETENPKLIYSYKSDPKANVKDRSAPHFGTAMLSIVNNKKELQGEYWSSRETTGTIHLEFWRKEKIDIYKDEFGEHPMSESK